MSRPPSLSFRIKCAFVTLTVVCASTLPAAEVSGESKSASERIGVQRGVCVVLGLVRGELADCVRQGSIDGDYVVYFQSPNADEVAILREAGQKAGVLGTQLFVDQGDWNCIHLADNLAAVVLMSPEAEAAVSEKELLRVLHPGGKAFLADREIVKPFPEGTDSWSHPHHGPDNNPQSNDQLARFPYLTQFLADPKFCPMPEVSVAAGGRVFRAFGHIAHKANQNAMLNTLICANAYNGTILWKRALPKGFMIHRNTMIATPDTLYLADHDSCKLIDAATGEVKDEIVVPDAISDGPAWKWMAMVDGVLYALVGAKEFEVPTQPSQTPGMGHWPWGMWPGHDYADPKTNFGFGRTLLAINPSSKEVLWNHREEDFMDSRGVCMRNDRIYFYSPAKFLGCLDAESGDVVWKNTDAELLEAIGPDSRAQHPITGYSTQTFIKCTDDLIFFAGPHRNRMVVARTKDGKVVWQKEHGNFLLVLRDDAIYAIGPQLRSSPAAESGYKFAYEDGQVLANLYMRRACTRATGTVDSVFYRASGGTVRIDAATDIATHIAPMRPPCQDGVIVSDGNLYWGPWMCGCQLSLYGHICLTSAGDFDFQPGVEDSRLKIFADADSVEPLDVKPGDWPTHQGDNTRSSTTDAEIPQRVARTWTFDVPSNGFPTAPIAAGGLVFFGDRNGVVRAVDAADGKLQWQAFTSGAIYFPPAIDGGRLFVGSADGRVYAFEAATGRPLWTFRAAPAERWISVYGKLISTWPVSGGVVVQDGTVYAAAGIAHYDGTHVYALDAASGKVKWYNDSSGTTSEKAKHGVSLQGNLYIRDGELRFAGGGVHEEARYDLESGKCLNEPTETPRSSFHTAFYAYFPEYGKYATLDCTRADGTSLCYDCTYEGSWHGNLTLSPPLPAGARRPSKPISRWGVQRQRVPKGTSVWQQKPDRRYNSFIVADDVLLAAGHTGTEDTAKSFLAAVNLKDGSDIWLQSIRNPIVKGGTAINHQGQIVVSLESGQVLAFSKSD
ncbi:MAG: PQQ-binding-like beta-propeller repeat protein [Pirellulaceae bacterium]|nr:PQQ-binding-like beta-propeller repeat protein [Pirellulaceae bacterium]